MKKTAKFCLFVIGMMAPAIVMAQDEPKIDTKKYDVVSDKTTEVNTHSSSDNGNTQSLQSSKYKQTQGPPKKKVVPKANVKKAPPKRATNAKSTRTSTRTRSTASSKEKVRTIILREKDVPKPAPVQVPPVIYNDHRSWVTNHNYFGDTSATYEGKPDTLKYDLLRDGTLVPHTEDSIVALAPIDTCHRDDSTWKHKENLHCKGHRDWVLWHWKDKQKFKLRHCAETYNRDSVLRVRLWLVLGTAALIAFEDYACTQNYWLPRKPSSNGNSGNNNNNNGNDPAVIDTGDTNHHGTGNKPARTDVISRDETKSQKTNSNPVQLYKVQPITFGYSVKATFTFSIGSGLPFSKVLMNGFLHPRIQPLVFIKRQ
ncbi:MAG: hypothetical protein KBC17_02395 [Candidatus Pacebacteria bacterium]|nr:hypothetical protein [Candidatus Paceibacterota bacterium]